MMCATSRPRQAMLAQAHLQEVAGDSQTRHLMQLCLTGQASAEERAEFGCLWQDRVRRILLEPAHVQHPRRFSDTALCGSTQMGQGIPVFDPD